MLRVSVLQGEQSSAEALPSAAALLCSRRYLPVIRDVRSKFDESDGGVYHAGRWAPQYELDLAPGDALVLPAGMMHETRVRDDAEECTVSSAPATQMQEPKSKVQGGG